MRAAAILGLCTLASVPAIAFAQSQAQEAAGYAKLRLIGVQAPLLEKVATTQFLAADAKGNPLLLRGDTLEVFGLGADASFDRRVGELACAPPPGPAYAAAMDATSQTWAVASTDDVALCDFSKQNRPPALGWVVSSLTYSPSGPLVGVTSAGPAPDASTGRFKRTVPRVFGLADGRWQPVAWAPVTQFKEMPASPMDAMAAGKAQSDALYCVGRNDALWMASWNSYRLQKLSSSDKPDREIVVGSGEVGWQELKKDEQERETKDRRAQGGDRIPVPQSSAGIPRGVVRALLCARDGYLYLVVSTPEGLALDRYNPTQSSLDRVMLEGASLSSGPMTAALTSDQLWLGGRLTTDGLWRIPVVDLDTAHWKPVKNVKADGKPWG